VDSSLGGDASLRIDVMMNYEIQIIQRAHSGTTDGVIMGMCASEMYHL
jgi:hypothetical protein